MSDKRYGNFLTVLLVISILAILSLVGYFIYDIYTKYDSNKKAEEAVDAFQEQFLNNKNNNSNLSGNNNISNNNISIDNLENKNETTNDVPINNDGDSSTVTNNENSSPNKNTGSSNKNYVYKNKFEGYTILGTIEISKIKLKTPILKELSIDALKKATCLIYGNLNEEGNTVIIGHNNRNGTFFSNLKKLSNGDKITITDYTGKTVDYAVYSMFQASPDDTSFYQRDTNGLKEITLSTCTDNDDTKRIIVLAREI